MRIGIDARLYRSSAAGIGRYSQNLIKNLLKIDKTNQYILFLRPEDAKELKPKTYNLKPIVVDIPHYSLTEQTKLVKIIEKERLDLMHFTNFNHPINYHGKFIVTIHDLTLFHFPETAKKTNFIKRFGFKLVIKNAIKKSAKIIAVSEFTKKDIIRKFNIQPSKIKVIYEAADDKEFNCHPELVEGSVANAASAIRRRPVPSIPEGSFTDVQDDEPIILYVGQYRPHKNVEGLLKAFAILEKDIPAKLVLLGKMPEDFRVDNKVILRDIIVPGFVDDDELSAWYKLAQVFVFPSFYEGFGLPGLEAMTAGLPVAASNAGSLPEIFQDGALYFDPRRPEDMAEKIGKILQNDTIKKGLINKGFKVAKKYSWEKTALDTLRVYQETRNPND